MFVSVHIYFKSLQVCITVCANLRASVLSVQAYTAESGFLTSQLKTCLHITTCTHLGPHACSQAGPILQIFSSGFSVATNQSE